MFGIKIVNKRKFEELVNQLDELRNKLENRNEEINNLNNTIDRLQNEIEKLKNKKSEVQLLTDVSSAPISVVNETKSKRRTVVRKKKVN